MLNEQEKDFLDEVAKVYASEEYVHKHSRTPNLVDAVYEASKSTGKVNAVLNDAEQAEHFQTVMNGLLQRNEAVAYVEDKANSIITARSARQRLHDHLTKTNAVRAIAADRAEEIYNIMSQF